MLPHGAVHFRRTTLLTILCVAFLVGLAVARLNVAVPYLWVVAITCIAVATARHRTWLTVAVVLVFGFVCGCWRGGEFNKRLTPYSQLFGKKIVVQVVASEDATYGTNSQLTFESHESTVMQPTKASLPGRIKVSGFGETAVFKGDVVQVSGKLTPLRGGRQAQLGFAEIKVLSRANNPIDTVRRNFAAGTYSALPEPLASFGLGILVGQRSSLPDEVSKQLAAVGLTHVIAVSGYNLTIIVDAVRRLLRKRSKYQTVLCIAVLVGLFLMMTGMSASIVRASIISGLSIAAWYYGRTFKPLLLISLTAAITAGWNPLYLWGDIGWYLSFLAFFGVLVVAPLILRRMYGDHEPKFLQAILIETLAAQIMTLPLILFIFQQFSLISILSNVLVVPLIPLAMLVTLIAGLGGMWLVDFVGWLTWPARILLTYILDLVSVFSRVPHALTHIGLTVWGLVIMYGLICLVTFVLWRKTPKFATITDITEEE